MMHKHMDETATIALLLTLLALFPGPVQSEPLVTISGVISEEGQLIGNDGVIYEIADSEIGFDLIELTSHQVKVTGSVLNTDEITIILVETFEIVRK